MMIVISASAPWIISSEFWTTATGGKIGEELKKKKKKDKWKEEDALRCEVDTFKLPCFQ